MYVLLLKNFKLLKLFPSLSISIHILIYVLSYQTASLLLDLIVLVIAKINIFSNNYIHTLYFPYSHAIKWSVRSEKLGRGERFFISLRIFEGMSTLSYYCAFIISTMVIMSSTKWHVDGMSVITTFIQCNEVDINNIIGITSLIIC